MGKKPAIRVRRQPNRPERMLINGHAMSDEVIERNLLTGENSGILEDYFGPAQYQELRQLSQAAASRSVRGGDRVLILPGIMGSRLGYRFLPGFPDIIWFDPLDIAAGKLGDLELRKRRNIKALGVILFAYLGLKLRLRINGFDADFAPYDWRRSLRSLGRELADEIAKGERPVHLVAHSMGGLVARASLAHQPPIRRIVMLGTPNFGSFAPLQAVRGVYSVVRRIAQLDLYHSPEQLAKIFAEFPGLLEMIPVPGAGDWRDYFSLDNWPNAGVLPDATSLTKAKNVQASLPTQAPGTEIIMISGVNRETVVNAALSDNGHELNYTITNEGDGTVPLRCAVLPSATKNYYVEGEHGALANNAQIQRALPSILATGKTSELPESPPLIRSVEQRVISETALNLPPAERPRGQLPSVREQRLMLAELAAPDERSETIPPPPLPDALPTGAPTLAPAPRALIEISDRIVVGRGHQRRLEITLAQGSIVDSDAQCYVTGLFKTVAPGGAADALDQLMDGAISDLVSRRMFGANVGEVSILPIGSYPMRADSIAFVGLGTFDSFSAETLEIVGENLIRTLVAGRVNDFAMVPFGGSTFSINDKAVKSLLSGFIRGLEDADKDHRFRRITICESDPERAALIHSILFELAKTPMLDKLELTFRTRKLAPIFSAVTREKKPEEERIYLIVREAPESYADPSARPPLMASLLTTGDKAAIHSGEQPAAGDNGVLEQHLDDLDNIQKKTPKEMEAFGEKLAELILADNVRLALSHYADRHLVVVHDAGASRIPWETVRIGGAFPALAGGMSHRYEAANLSVAKWLEARQQTERLSILLVINPTDDLPGAEAEGNRIEELTQGLGSRVSLKVLRGAEARKSELLTCFSSGEYDVIHYAGHAFFDPNQRSRSGLLCSGREVLSGEDLAGVGNLPSLMFFNACEAARVRGEVIGAAQTSRSEMVQRNIGFAEALLRGGIANFIGTYWPVGDAAAKDFANEFYTMLLKSSSLNEALKAGREAVLKGRSQDWADYVFYGNPDFQLKRA